MSRSAETPVGRGGMCDTCEFSDGNRCRWFGQPRERVAWNCPGPKLKGKAKPLPTSPRSRRTAKEPR